MTDRKKWRKERGEISSCCANEHFSRLRIGELISISKYASYHKKPTSKNAGVYDSYSTMIPYHRTFAVYQYSERSRLYAF